MTSNRFNSKRVAIIGGGITGLYLAWKLSEKGNQVTVFEKKKELGKKECSGLVSGELFKFVPQGKELVKNQIDFVLVHFPRKTFKIRFKKEFFVLDHAELDKLVAGLAKKARAEMLLGKTIHYLPQGFDRIVGCDGYNSFVRKSLRLKDPVFRLTMQGFLEEKNDSGCVETWAVKNGFIWKIPRAGETEYGIIAEPAYTRKLFERFCRQNKLKLKRMQSSIIPQGLAISYNPRIALCGDAAGLTKPWSGGGIVWGLRAADILLETFPDFTAYNKRVRKEFKPRIAFSKALTGFGYFIAFNLPWFLPKEIKIEGDSLI